MYGVIVDVPIHLVDFWRKAYSKVDFEHIKILAAIFFMSIPTIKYYCTYNDKLVLWYDVSSVGVKKELLKRCEVKCICYPYSDCISLLNNSSQNKVNKCILSHTFLTVHFNAYTTYILPQY